MKTQWEYDLVENPFCEQIKGMGWEWVDEARIAGANITAIEVKSGRKRERLPGMEAFARAFRVKRQLLVGSQGIPVGEFLSTPVETWLR